MRRQLKPFVTEYRGGMRRGKDPVAEPQSEGNRNRAFEDAQRVFQPDPSEDSYEAALRAADALFSRAPQAPPTSPAPQPAFIEAQVWKTPDETTSDEPPAADTASLPHADAFPPKAAAVAPQRRILQAIEPEQDDRFAALEAERAPKRRGRKPGSKNKPKVVVGDDWPAVVPVSPAVTVAANDDRARPAFSWGDDWDDDAPEDAIADVEAETVVSVSDDGSEPSGETQPRGRNDKFVRRRAGLRPGERWKRRLPKAAW